MSALLYNIGDERWYDPEFGPMILRCHFNEDAKPEQVLVDLFGLIEEVGLPPVRRPGEWSRPSGEDSSRGRPGGEVSAARLPGVPAGRDCQAVG